MSHLPIKRTTVVLPKARSPFINAELISLGSDQNGEERFWISTWNNLVGCMGVVVTESGEYRIYQFKQTPGRGGTNSQLNQNSGFYSVAQENGDVLWLCGNLAYVSRLTLSSGKLEEYQTGAPPALVFKGMAFDKESGKLFAAGQPRPNPPTAFSFDIAKRKPVKVHADIARDCYMRCSFPNGDGSYSIIMNSPGQTFVRWNPGDESIEQLVTDEKIDMHNGRYTTNRLTSDGKGLWYIPAHGWYNPLTRKFVVAKPVPEIEMTWFARRDDLVWGVANEKESARIGIWDLSSGKVKEICIIPNCQFYNMNLTASGKLVAVNIYGEFFRYDGLSGVLELTRKLPSDSYLTVDCLCRINQDRLLGTPFISQRFWELNLRTGKRYDCGRAAPGFGQICFTRKIGAKVYMGAYTGGELMEYDPLEHPHFPENPRVVADPPDGMRPVASCDDGRNLYYACSLTYGHLGSVLVKYDTKTGINLYKENPIPDQQITTMHFDRRANALLCATTIHADCQSAPPSSHNCCFALIDAKNLTVIKQAQAPDGIAYAYIFGPIDDKRWFCVCARYLSEGRPEFRWFLLDVSFNVPAISTMPTIPDLPLYSGKKALYIRKVGNRIQLWNLNNFSLVRDICDGGKVSAIHVQDELLYLVYSRKIAIIDNLFGERAKR